MTSPAGLRIHLPGRRRRTATLVVARYAAHARSLGYRVTLGCAEDLGAAPWERGPLAELAADPEVAVGVSLLEPLADDELALVAVPRDYHLAYRELPPGSSPERTVHLVDDVRYADPGWRDGNGTRVLTRPAARISTSLAVAAAIAPWLDHRALHRTIDAGHGPAREQAALGSFLVDLGARLAAYETPQATSFISS